MTAPTTPFPGGRAGGPDDPLGPLTGAAARLVAAVEELAAEAAVSLDPVSSLQRTEAVLLARARLRAVELDGVTDADLRELFVLRHAGSVGTWLGALPAAAGGGARLMVARRVARSAAARAALASGTVAPVAVERVLSVIDRLPDRVLDAVTAGHTGTLQTPTGRVVEPAEAKDAAARFTAVVTDGLRSLVGPVPDPDTFETHLTALAQPDCDSAEEVRERLTTAFLLLAAHTHPGQLTPGLRDLTDALLPAPDPSLGDPHDTAARLVLHELLDGWGHLEADLPPEVYADLRDDLHDRVTTARTRHQLQQTGQPNPPDRPDETATTVPVSRQRPTGRELHSAFVDHLRDTLTPDQQPAGHSADDAEDAPSDAVGGTVPAVLRKPRPVNRIVITVTDRRLTGQPGALVARSSTGRRLHDTTLHAALCHAGLTVLLTDLRGATLDAATTRRTATPTQWAAMTVEWGGLCAVLGCGRPATVPHHVLPFHLHGPTTPDNQRPLCDSCHHDVHLGARTLRLRDGTLISPTGRVHPPPDQPPERQPPERQPPDQQPPPDVQPPDPPLRP